MHCAIREFCWNSRSGFRLLTVLLLFPLLWWSDITLSAPITAEQAKKMTQAWVTANPKPMNSQLGSQIDSIETFTDANGQPIYYVIYLRPNGFVIVPADDEIEPVICFAQGGSFDPSPDNPLGDLVSRDLPGRVNAARAIQKMVRSGRAIQSFTQQEMDIRHSGEKAFGKWSKLLNAADSCSVLAMSLGGISDVRVSPLLQSEWNQTTIAQYCLLQLLHPAQSTAIQAIIPAAALRRRWPSICGSGNTRRRVSGRDVLRYMLMEPPRQNV